MSANCHAHGNSDNGTEVRAKEKSLPSFPRLNLWPKYQYCPLFSEEEHSAARVSWGAARRRSCLPTVSMRRICEGLLFFLIDNGIVCIYISGGCLAWKPKRQRLHFICHGIPCWAQCLAHSRHSTILHWIYGFWSCPQTMQLLWMKCSLWARQCVIRPVR